MRGQFRRPPRLHPEQDAQTAIANYLRAVLVPPVWFTAIPADEAGDMRRGKKFKAMGYKAGTPDMMILDGGRAFFGEVKAMKGVLSNAQHDTIPAIKRARCPVHIWRSIDDVAASLAEWGIPTREAKRNVEGVMIDKKLQAHIEMLEKAKIVWPDSGPLVRRRGAK